MSDHIVKVSMNLIDSDTFKGNLNLMPFLLQSTSKMSATQLSILGQFETERYDQVVARLAASAHQAEAFDCEETIFERGAFPSALYFTQRLEHGKVGNIETWKALSQAHGRSGQHAIIVRNHSTKWLI